MPSAVWMPWALRGIRAVADLVGAWVLARLVRRMLGRLRGYTIRVMDRRRRWLDHRDGEPCHHHRFSAHQTIEPGDLADRNRDGADGAESTHRTAAGGDGASRGWRSVWALKL